MPPEAYDDLHDQSVEDTRNKRSYLKSRDAAKIISSSHTLCYSNINNLVVKSTPTIELDEIQPRPFAATRIINCLKKLDKLDIPFASGYVCGCITIIVSSLSIRAVVQKRFSLRPTPVFCCPM
jgi:hypothetical protein